MPRASRTQPAATKRIGWISWLGAHVLTCVFLEGVLQSGRFGADRIDAWGAGGEVARRFRTLALQPEVAVMLDVISGDRDRDDDRLGTFTPMFPRGKYFAAGTPLGPRNLIHVQPSATLYPAFSPGSFIRETGPARTMKVAAGMADFRF